MTKDNEKTLVDLGQQLRPTQKKQKRRIAVNRLRLTKLLPGYVTLVFCLSMIGSLANASPIRASSIHNNIAKEEKKNLNDLEHVMESSWF